MARTRKRYADLEEKVKSYFEDCDEKNSGQKSIIKPYTVSGLICHLGITRAEFERLSRTSNHSYLMTAKMRIEAFIEENSLTGGLSCNASANSLKYNFGWGEKLIAEQSADAKSIVISLEADAQRLAR